MNINYLRKEKHIEFEQQRLHYALTLALQAPCARKSFEEFLSMSPKELIDAMQESKYFSYSSPDGKISCSSQYFYNDCIGDDFKKSEWEGCVRVGEKSIRIKVPFGIFSSEMNVDRKKILEIIHLDCSHPHTIDTPGYKSEEYYIDCRGKGFEKQTSIYVNSVSARQEIKEYIYLPAMDCFMRVMGEKFITLDTAEQYAAYDKLLWEQYKAQKRKFEQNLDRQRAEEFAQRQSKQPIKTKTVYCKKHNKYFVVKDEEEIQL